MDRLPFLAFLFALALIFYGLGVVTIAFRLPPTSILMSGYETAIDITSNWKNDLGYEPTRLLVPASDPKRRQLHVAAPERLAAGDRLVAGLMPDRSELTGAVLLSPDGVEKHYWPVDYARLFPEGRSATNVFLHGIAPLPDGSLLVDFDGGEILARIDSCGEPIWLAEGDFHHLFGIDSGNNSVWIWENAPADGSLQTVDKHLVKLDIRTGERLHTLSLEKDIISRHDNYGRFALRTDENGNFVEFCCNPFHPNDVEVLSPEMAPAFPAFAAGDLLLSFRSLNMIGVIDPETGTLKWSKIGPWHRQHDPDFQPDGTITVYDNQMGLGASRIVEVDPQTNRTQVLFDGAENDDFYSYRRGQHEVQENGNILIAESEKGRAMEVAPDGQIVWEYNNIFDAERNGLVNALLNVPEDYFAPGALDSQCQASG